MAGGRLPGDWQLHATIALDESRALATPQAGRIGAMTFSFTTVMASPTAIEVRLQARGAEAGALSSLIPDALKGHPALQLELFGADGTLAQPLTIQIDDVSGSVDAVWARSGPGTYRLVVGYAAIGTFERSIEVH